MIPDISKPLKKCLPMLLKAQEDHVNEANTVAIIVKVFVDVFGYDQITEITHEMSINDNFADMAIKLDERIEFLVEAKAADRHLKDKYIDQAYKYASQSNIRWVLLTNGVQWNLYHLTFEEGIEYDMAFSVDLTDGITDKTIESLTLLHKNSVKGKGLETFWQKLSALNPTSIAKALFTEKALKFLRKEIHHNGKMLIDAEDLADSIYGMLSEDTRVKMGPLKIHHAKKQSQKKINGSVPATDETCPPVIGKSELTEHKGD